MSVKEELENSLKGIKEASGKAIQLIEEQLAKLKELEKSNKPVFNKGQWYWSITDVGRVEENFYHGSKYDKSLLEIGNCFKTKEDAEFELERLKVISELKSFSNAFTPGENNYCIVYDYLTKEIHSREEHYMKTNDIYFKSEEILNQAIIEVGENRVNKYYLGITED